MPISSTTSMMSVPWPSPAVISLTTTSHSTTGPCARASRTQRSAASAMRGSSPSRSMRTDVSMAIIGRASGVDRVAGGAAAKLAHHVVGAHALGQAEPAAGARDGVVDVLAQDDPAAFQLHLQQGALGQAEGIAHGLGQGDLSALGDGGFHGGSCPDGHGWNGMPPLYIPCITYPRPHTGSAATLPVHRGP